ncbi:MAG: DNA-binding protein WhiA [Lachnospiraceae bacterium]|nr:DNA-binding protein WhiA [Lachnospiraceae bacterium]
MSFSSDVKSELLKQVSNARHCQLAELSAIFDFCGTFVQKNRENSIIFLNCENDLVAQKTFTLLKKAFNIYSCVDENEDLWTSEEASQKIFIEGENSIKIHDAVSSHLVTQKSCCKRAYLRGAYLCGGSVSDPEKSYHLEIVCKGKELADKVKDILNSFDVDAKITMRKEHYIVYIKGSSQIVETLNIIGSPVALMEFENTIILKDMRNSINRRNNCDTANITKTVSAAVRQIEDIKLIMDKPEYKKLPDSVKEIAELRLEYPEASLKELGEYANPPLGKSGVNHRLRKLSELAERFRGAIL